MIPKIIHYCWFGETELPKQYADFIQEWKTLNPKYTIKRWDETNCKFNTEYLLRARQNKNWANLSNYFRFYVLLHYGGIYLDTDIKLLKPIDELLLNKCFFGFEEGQDDASRLFVNNAVMGAEKKHPFIKNCLNAFTKKFDGLESPAASSPSFITEMLKLECDLKDYGFQTINDITIYPTTAFYPINWENAYKTKNVNPLDFPDSYSIHCWGRTWWSKETMLEIIDHNAYQLNSLKERISFSEGVIVSQSSSLAEKEKEISGLNEKIASNDGIIFSQNSSLVEKEKEMQWLNERITFSEGIILSQSNSLAEKEKELEVMKKITEKYFEKYIRVNFFRYILNRFKKENHFLH